MPVARDLVSPARVRAQKPDNILPPETTDIEDSADPSRDSAITAAQALLDQAVPPRGNQAALLEQFNACVKAREGLADAMRRTPAQDAPLLEQWRQRLGHRMHMVTFRMTEVGDEAGDGDRPVQSGESRPLPSNPKMPSVETRSAPRPSSVESTDDEDAGDDHDPADAIQFDQFMQIVERRNAGDQRLTDAGHSRLHKLAQLLVHKEIRNRWPQEVFGDLCACIGIYQKIAGAPLPRDAGKARQTLEICRQLAQRMGVLFLKVASDDLTVEGLNLADHTRWSQSFQDKEDACVKALARLAAATPRTEALSRTPAVASSDQRRVLLTAQLKLSLSFEAVVTALNSPHLHLGGKHSTMWQKIEETGLGVLQILDSEELIDRVRRDLDTSWSSLPSRQKESMDRFEGQMAALLTRLHEELTQLPGSPLAAVAQLKAARRTIDSIQAYMDHLPDSHYFMGMEIRQLDSALKTLYGLRQDIREALHSIRVSIDQPDTATRKAGQRGTRRYLELKQNLAATANTHPFLTQLLIDRNSREGSKLDQEHRKVWQPLETQDIAYRLNTPQLAESIINHMKLESTSTEYIHAQLYEHARQVKHMFTAMPSYPVHGLQALQLCRLNLKTMEKAAKALQLRKAKVAGLHFSGKHSVPWQLSVLQDAIDHGIQQLDKIIMER